MDWPAARPRSKPTAKFGEADRAVRSGRATIRDGSHIDGYLALLDLPHDGATPEMLVESGLTSWQLLLHQRAISCVRQGEIPNNGHTMHQWLEFIYPAHKLPYILKALDEFDLDIQRPVQTPNAPLPMNENRSVVFVREARGRRVSSSVAIRANARQTGRSERLRIARRSRRERMVAARQRPKMRRPSLSCKSLPTAALRDYRIEITCADANYPALWPLTSLPHEAAVLTKGRNWLGAGALGTRLYVAPDDSAPTKIVVSSNSKRAMGMEFVDREEHTLHRVSDSRYVGDPQTVEMKSLGDIRSIYLSDEADISFKEDAQLTISDLPERLFHPPGSNPPTSSRREPRALAFKGRYVHPEDKHPLILSVNPDRYFQPEPAVLEWEPTSD